MTPDRSASPTLRLSVMMFLQFFVWGGFYVPMAKYLNVVFSHENNLGGIIAGAYATQTIAAIIAPLIVGLLADRFFPAQVVNGLLHLLGGVMLWLAAGAVTPATFWWLMFAYFLCYMPTLPLVNSISFRHVASPDRDFPRIRVWGTIGWIVACLIVAQSVFGLLALPVFPGVADAGATAIPFRLCAVVSLIYGLYSFTLPHTPPAARQEKASLGKMLGMDALQLMKHPGFAVMIACSFLLCIPLAFYYARTNDFIASMGVKATESKMALGQMSEIGFMLLVPFFLTRFGVRWMLLVGMLAWVARYALFGLFPGVEVLLLLGIILHGVCYDFFFVTGQLYVDRIAPKEIRASAQGLIALVTYGAGMFAGNMVLGWWVDSGIKLGAPPAWQEKATAFWMFPAGLALVVAVVFFVLFRDPAADRSPPRDS